MESTIIHNLEANDLVRNQTMMTV